jgi:hypothetical protein
VLTLRVSRSGFWVLRPITFGGPTLGAGSGNRGAERPEFYLYENGTFNTVIGDMRIPL